MLVKFAVSRSLLRICYHKHKKKTSSRH